MGGPSAGVLLRTEVPTWEIRAAALDAFEFEDHGDPPRMRHAHGLVADCSIDGRPFIIDHGPECPGVYAEIELSGFSRVVGWPVADVIVINAMCNGKEDHLILGRLCLAFADAFDAIVDLCGCPCSAELGRRLPGRLYFLPAVEHDGTPLGYETFYCDADFMRAWITQPGFHMIK